MDVTECFTKCIPDVENRTNINIAVSTGNTSAGNFKREYVYHHQVSNSIFKTAAYYQDY